MNKMSVVITSYHQRALTLNAVKSYQHFCPKDFDLKIIVVENSGDDSYKDETLSMGDNIVWVQNDTYHRGANANANGVEVGMRYVGDEYVFLSHNDVCITSRNFFTSMSELVDDGYRLIGTCYDTHPLRNHSIIILGCLVDPEIVRAVDLYPLDRPNGQPYFECGDRVHIFCRDHNIKHLCYDNTHNMPELAADLPDPYNSLHYSVRTVDQYGEVIFVHFARGTIKTMGKYNKEGRLDINGIVNFCETHVFTKQV